jgi:hypothetical protein
MGQIIKAIFSPITSLISGITGGDKKEREPEPPPLPQEDPVQKAELARAREEADAARARAEQQATEERARIQKSLDESAAREKQRTDTEAAAEEQRQRALRARQIGRRSLLSQSGDETGVQTTFGG